MPSSTTSVAIAVIGAGLIGPRHAEAILQEPAAKLACLVDPSPQAKDAAKQLNVPLYASVREMLDSPHRPDAAIVCTPNHTHVALSEELLNDGIHVLVEKPISTDVESGKRLVELAKTKPAKLLVGHHRRFNKYMVTAKTILSSQDVSLGRPIAVNGIWTIYKPPEYYLPPADWRRNKESGGPILINLVHEIDLMHHLLGPIVRVQAERGPDSKAVRGEEHGAECGAAITMKFESGAVGTFLLADNTPSPFNFEAGTGENPTIPKVGMDFYRIFCEEGVLSVPDMRIWRYNSAKGDVKSWTSHLSEEQMDVMDTKMPFELQVAHFVNVIRGTEEPSCSGEDGLRALVVCNAVRTALDTGNAVSIAV